MGDIARQLGAKLKPGGCFVMPAAYRFRTGGRVKGSVAFNGSQSTAVECQKIPSATTGWIQVANPLAVGPNGAANVERMRRDRSVLQLLCRYFNRIHIDRSRRRNALKFSIIHH